MSKDAPIAKAVANGHTLYEVKSVTGSTIELDYRKSVILACIERAISCIVYKYTGEVKHIVLQKDNNRTVFGSIDSIREQSVYLTDSTPEQAAIDTGLTKLGELFGDRKRRGTKSTLSDSDKGLFAT